MSRKDLKLIIRERGLSYAEIAEITGLSLRTVQEILNGADCRVSSLKKIVDSLGLELTISSRVELRED